MGLLVALLVSLTVATPSQAAPPARPGGDSCVRQKSIWNWQSPEQLRRKGFNIDVFGDQASLTFANNHRFMSLDLASNPTNAQPMASRITEIDGQQPIAQRVKCWQATERENVVLDFIVRFQQPTTPPGLTENLLLWNAPLPSPGSGEAPMLMTAIGVTRSLNQPYSAVVAQDFNFTNFSGLFSRNAMPSWLDATKWHFVRTTISRANVTIAVAQDGHGLTQVAQVALPHPADPLGFEFSLDNEAFPGQHVPVSMPDGLDVAFFGIGMEHSH
jgi:hypothetical protein